MSNFQQKSLNVSFCCSNQIIFFVKFSSFNIFIIQSVHKPKSLYNSIEQFCFYSIAYLKKHLVPSSNEYASKADSNEWDESQKKSVSCPNETFTSFLNISSLGHTHTNIHTRTHTHTHTHTYTRTHTHTHIHTYTRAIEPQMPVIFLQLA